MTQSRMSDEVRLRMSGGRFENPTDFGKILYEHISKAGMSANEFARKVEMTSGFMSAVYTGKKRPSLRRLNDWADCLGLKGKTRQRFILAAHLEHVTDVIKGVFKQYSKLALAADEKGVKVRGVDPKVLASIFDG